MSQKERLKIETGLDQKAEEAIKSFLMVVGVLSTRLLLSEEEITEY